MAKPPNLKQTDPSYAAWMKKSERVRDIHTARAGCRLELCSRRSRPGVHAATYGTQGRSSGYNQPSGHMPTCCGRSLARDVPPRDLAIPGPRLWICPCELHSHRADGATHVYCVVHLGGRCVVLRFLSMPKRKGTAKTEKASAAHRKKTTGGGAEETDDPEVSSVALEFHTALRVARRPLLLRAVMA